MKLISFLRRRRSGASSEAGGPGMNTEPCLLRWEQVWLAAQRPFVALRLVPQEGGSCVFAPAKFTVSLPSDATNDHLMGDFLGGAILAEPFSQKDRRFIRSFIQNQPFFFVHSFKVNNLIFSGFQNYLHISFGTATPLALNRLLSAQPRRPYRVSL